MLHIIDEAIAENEASFNNLDIPILVPAWR